MKATTRRNNRRSSCWTLCPARTFNVRIALGIEYDGTAYNGWQRQKSGIGVQERVEDAVSAVANQAIDVICAGAHRYRRACLCSGGALSTRLRNAAAEVGCSEPTPTSRTTSASPGCSPVDDEFHARFTATGRRYEYRILNRLNRSALASQPGMVGSPTAR